jgi:glutathione-specific gamma-glutamylcyclotransferase
MNSPMSEHPPPPFPPLRPLTEAERKLSLEQTLAAAPGVEPIWVFAYGSLLWDPCFAFDEASVATLPGYRRAFNIWTILTRGTPENPGLGLGLEAGGQCQGMAYRLSESSRARDLEAIWSREMYGLVYEPRWLPLQMPGGPQTALCFVTNPAHAQYAGTLTPARTAEFIARAHGAKGSSRDYLAQTVAALARHGVSDPFLNELLALVERLPPAPKAGG